MLLVVADLLAVRRDVGFRLRSQLLVPVAFAFFLLLELLLLHSVGFFGAAVGVFFDLEGRGGGEGADGAADGAGAHLAREAGGEDHFGVCGWGSVGGLGGVSVVLFCFVSSWGMLVWSVPS